MISFLFHFYLCREAVELDSDACQAQLSTPPAASAELEVGAAAAASHPQVDISSTAVQVPQGG